MVSALPSLHSRLLATGQGQGQGQGLPSWRKNTSLLYHAPFPLLGRMGLRPPGRLRATAPGPPQPPIENNDSLSGLQAGLSKIHDRVRIFIAVLFWMSLFFWGSAWDGRDGIRKNKGPKFRK